MPLLLTLPLPTAETQPRTTAGKQLTNTALAARSPPSLPVHLSQRDQTAGRVKLPLLAHCAVPCLPLRWLPD